MSGRSRSTASPPRPLVGSVVQAVAVLRHLGSIERPEGVTAIATRLGLSPSSCFNILKTLAAEGLATFDPIGKGYGLGPGTIELARTALGRNEATGVARSAMDRIAEDFDLAVGLWRLSADRRCTLIAVAESEAATRIHLVIGQRQPVEAGALGRAILAVGDAPEKEIVKAVLAGRWHAAPTPAEYVVQVAEARLRGWAIDVGQMIAGITTIAAPIVDTEQQVRFCLSASTFTSRDTPDRIVALGEAMRSAAQAVIGGIFGIDT